MGMLNFSFWKTFQAFGSLNPFETNFDLFIPYIKAADNVRGQESGDISLQVEQ